MKLWQNIDPVEAEARLRGFNRRLADLDEAMKAGQRMLAYNPESFSAQLSLESLTHLHERLQAERTALVKHRTREKITVSLNGSEFEDHTASIGQLGPFLLRMQSLYQSIAQAITTGPKLRGPISNEIMRSTNMRFADVFPSSFGMELFVETPVDESGENTAVSSLQTLFGLLNATSRQDEIARLSAELGNRSLNHLRHILSNLNKAGAGFSLKWTDSAGTDYSWTAKSDDIPVLRGNISRFHENYVGEVQFEGALIGASLLRNRFEFMDMNRNVIEGKITRAVKPKLKEHFGRWCLAKFDQVEIIESFSGEAKSYFTMIDIEPKPTQTALPTS